MFVIKESNKSLFKISQKDNDILVEINNRKYSIIDTIKTNEALISLLIMKNILTRKEIDDYLESVKVIDKLTE